jgi:chemotaxis protein methyltransferase CheR
MEAREYSLVRKEILTLTGVDIDCYKGVQMQRRLNAFLQRSGQPTWRDFFHWLRQDPIALNKFKDYLTINVSSFFRDPEKYRYLQEVVLPELLREHPTLRLWSAGCSHGQEPYSLAVLLMEMTDRSRHHRILATDIDRAALEWAQAGGPYTADEVANIPPAWLHRYFTLRDGGYWVNADLQRPIVFRQHNLLSDPFEKGFDLIVCRNVVIYFTAAAKEQVYRRFYEALRPGGVLFVGGTEVISRASDIGYTMMGISFYRRNGTAPSHPIRG